VVNCCYIVHSITLSSFIQISLTNLKIVKTDQNKFLLRCVHHSAGSITSSVKSGLSLLVLPVPPFLQEIGSLQASPFKNFVVDKEHLYTATYHYNKKENLSLLWQ